MICLSRRLRTECGDFGIAWFYSTGAGKLDRTFWQALSARVATGIQSSFPVNNRSLSVMIQATQLRRGNTILLNGELYQVVDYQHITPGNWRGMVQTKLRKLSTGSIIDHRFRSEDRVDRAILDEREMEYLYKDGTDYYFMDTENYEQTHLNEDVLGDATSYLVPNSKIKVEFYEGKPLGIELPATIDLKVVQTDPGMPSATVSNVLKPATLETGLVVGVPHFIQEGEVIRVDTTEGKYVERVRS